MKRITIEEVMTRFHKAHGDRYDYSKFTTLKNTTTKIPIICKIHGEFPQIPKFHWLGQGCPDCAGNVQKDTEQFIAEARAIHGDTYSYEKVIYTNNIDKIIIICPVHGEFPQAPVEHLSPSGCRKCVDDSHRKSLEQFIIDSNKFHNNFYNYDKFEYVSSATKGIIICPKHGEFPQSPNSHGKNGCPDCGKEKVKNSVQDFKERSAQIHNNKYSYEQITDDTDVTSSQIIPIICPVHSVYYQMIRKHLEGSGCEECGIDNRRYTYQEFIDAANIKHKNIYVYEDPNYIDTREKTVITCKEHGTFPQTGGSHLNGSGCPSCSHRISRPEIAWLDSLGIPQEYRQAKIVINGRTFRPDAYDPTTNFCYEFLGNYWHGNPAIYPPDAINSATKTTFRQLYEKTMAREAILKEAGYTVISIWEDDFEKQLAAQTTNKPQ